MKKLIMKKVSLANLQATVGVIFLSSCLLFCWLILAPITCWSADAAHSAIPVGTTNSVGSISGAGQIFVNRPEVLAYIQELVASTNHFSATELARVFSGSRFSKEVLNRAPGTNQPWFQFRDSRLTESRISGGVEFMSANAAPLARAKKVYGVPPEIIAAIICMETDYGRFPLRFKALESLATLAFYYPPRTNYFRNELTQFLLLCREEKWEPLQIPSSRDGGLGLCQFMPTSYRQIAIDFDGDGQRNLLTSPADAIGSIGNYLKLEKWQQTNSPLAVRAVVAGTNYQAAIQQSFPIRNKNEFWRTIGQWQALGVRPSVPLPADRLAVLIEMQGERDPEQWLVFWNFNVVTTYNHSSKYALAVDLLSQAIRRAAATAQARTSTK